MSDLDGVIRRVLGDERIRCEFGNHIGYNTFDCQECALDAKLEHIEKVADAIVAEDERKQAPYPWCHGNPTVKDCIEAGYCRRDPSCGD